MAVHPLPYLALMLSASTQKYGRGLKVQEYRQIDLLEECSPASQGEPRGQGFRRPPVRRWLLAGFAELESVRRVGSVSAAIPLAEIYSTVEFPAEGPRPAA